jgi:hypothetical protein
MTWRLRWPRLSGTGRAGLIAAAAFALTGAAAVLLAVWSHQPWPAALASVLILVPGLYLALKAVPKTARQARERPARAWDPVELRVHKVTGGGPLPSYIRRPHDDLLDALLDPAVTASRLVVVRGGSSTGKSRAAFEAATRGRLARWRMDYPREEAGLSALLEAGVPARTILWLAELRDYTSGQDGGAAVLGRLARLLEGQDRVIAVTTMWPEHWDKYTEAARTRGGLGQDPAGTAGRLLAPLPDLTGHDPTAIDPARGGVIDVPATFTPAEVTAAARADPRLADAAKAAAHAGQDGQLAQYLAGVPDLLNRYSGPGGDPYGQAIITVAMDAARFGCEDPLPAAVLLGAAPGYLTSQERTRDISSWASPGLDWATADLQGAVRAVLPVPPVQGTGIVGYRPADYLDQHGRRTRRHEIGPTTLWDALVANTAGTADLIRLGNAAEDRGLYRHASALWTRAAALGSTTAATRLVDLLRRANPGYVTRAARWAADSTELDDASALAHLLNALRDAGASDAVAALLARDPAAYATLDSSFGAVGLLRALHKAGDSEGASVLAARVAGHPDLHNAAAFADWLSVAHLNEGGDAVPALLARDPAAHVSLNDLRGVASLLNALRDAGAREAVTILTDRVVASASIADVAAFAILLDALNDAGASDAVAVLLARDPATHASLDEIDGVARLLYALHDAGASGAITTLAARAAGHASVQYPADVARLLDALHRARASDAVITLAARAADQTNLDDPWWAVGLLEAVHRDGASDAVPALATRTVACASVHNPADVARLLNALHQAGASDAVAMLLARDPATHSSLDDIDGVAQLLNALQRAGADEAVATLAARAAACASLDNPWRVGRLLDALREAGVGGAGTTLATRAADRANLDDSADVARLLYALQRTGAVDAVTALGARAAACGSLDNVLGAGMLLRALGQIGASDAAIAFAARAENAGMTVLWEGRPLDGLASLWPGREPDGILSHPWTWQEPPPPRDRNLAFSDEDCHADRSLMQVPGKKWPTHPKRSVRANQARRTGRSARRCTPWITGQHARGIGDL